MAGDNRQGAQQPAASQPLLTVDNLAVSFASRDGAIDAVRGLSFELAPGEVLGIVGESGSGKSQTVLSLMGLLAENGKATGSVKLEGRELLGLKPRQLNEVRGNDMSMIFQDPMTCLNPYMTIAKQMTEVLKLHQGMGQSAALKRSIEVLDAVHIPDAASRIQQYPHEFSGGMRQRVMIAMALLCEPKLLIADEPTTALDVTVQAQILSLLKELRDDFGTAVIFITHDLGVVAGTCDRVLVMYAGRVIERAPVDQLFADPRHPYTHGLLASLPKAGGHNNKLIAIPGSPPQPGSLPPGCEFAPRCRWAFDRCQQEVPQLTSRSAAPLQNEPQPQIQHDAACFLDKPGGREL